MKPFKLHDLVIWIDEQSDDITGIITEVNEKGFRIHWESTSPYDERKNQVFYRWEFLNLKTESFKSVIQLDISRIRERKIDNILR